MAKRSVRDLDVHGRRVLLRADFNVPLDPRGRIADDYRIRATMPTIRLLTDRGAKVVLISHMGRPKDREPELSLAPVRARLEDLLGRQLRLLGDCVGPEVEEAVARLDAGAVILLENLRYHPGEPADTRDQEPGFADQLAALGEAYVNDAFGACHRSDTSIVELPRRLPAAMGLLLEREVTVLDQVLHNPSQPLVVVLGGSKVEDKIGVVLHLLPIADRVLIGGGAAFTFLRARGYEIGRSRLDPKHLEACRQALERHPDKILLPTDVLIATGPDMPQGSRVVRVDAIPPDWMGVDIGPETARAFSDVLRQAQTVVWNGPMGIFEQSAFAQGTKAIAHVLRGQGVTGATVIVGGGDTVAAVQQLGYADGIDHLSTGGGAMLEYLEGKELPGLAALPDQ
ncbi:MAG: phosphoglycerate kinase [Armatimonadetes bacterium]|nr:phosphoglycerate kinase [Armatimonadota bacterium]